MSHHSTVAELWKPWWRTLRDDFGEDFMMTRLARCVRRFCHEYPDATPFEAVAANGRLLLSKFPGAGLHTVSLGTRVFDRMCERAEVEQRRASEARSEAVVPQSLADVPASLLRIAHELTLIAYALGGSK